ncbi:outer membrane protein assembly factor BamE domain-containing protein [Aliidiomarina maris]|uniref:SmpA/OmlA family protein n=1 Tax=Aliidiomarina maris TaxID=531312 RepID=A0A327X140_9GAMM|nr:outer membrane protein assembly factor BamE [Aliidiomarina maris]MBA3988469.1 hypothetical protein [Idiomarina sp.]MCL5049222.1 outer membrane protein assembly factor BamE [Bacillota bacterium]RAJ98994.1 SmpA/OmlA family protein [Aliidiomarina maris]RUO25129.1 hypothetical protein CWE07_06555 [Aliidiomarina maris]
MALRSVRCAVCLGACILILTGCTTTTRSVNESPRDPQAQRTTSSTPSAPRQRNTSRTSPVQALTAAQMDTLSQADVDSLLVRERTSSTQVAQIFGRPHSTTRSGDELYWNYTHQFRDERRRVGGLKSLTILFDRAGRVLDYDFQDNTFDLP